MQMITPLRVFIVALVLGVGIAAILYWQTPLPPADDPAAVATAVRTPPSTRPAMELAGGKRQTLADGLVIIDVVEGDGLPAKAGDNVSVNYAGKLYYGGDQFDASADHGAPLDFQVGAGQMIKGVDEGIVGMKLHGKRELMIPPELAYGAQGAGGGKIPPNAPLVFDLDMAKIQSAAAGQ